MKIEVNMPQGLNVEEHKSVLLHISRAVPELVIGKRNKLGMKRTAPAKIIGVYCLIVSDLAKFNL